jgi:hypothetical protein
MDSFDCIMLFDRLKDKGFHVKTSSCIDILIMLFNFLFSVSPCANNPCENNGTCSIDVNGNATCTCDGKTNEILNISDWRDFVNN